PAAAALAADVGSRAGDPVPAAGPTSRDVSALPDVVARPGAVSADTVPTWAEPVRIVIETIGVSAAVEAVGLEPDGSLSPPRDPSTVGWHSGSRIPGDRGPAVLVGHLDSADGPAVFIALDDLGAGDVIAVEGGDGTIVSFEVTSVTHHPRDAFPTEAVYGPTPNAELRLITCGGPFDRATGYADNVVVSATAIDSRHVPQHQDTP
ncbi:MAG: class F sortase, partial [Jiangellaceae bacterium]